MLSTAQRQQVEGYLAWKWGISSSFQPTSISGLSLWLDGADSTTLTLSGSNVTQWRDKSGNGRDVSQNTVSFQPTYSNTRVNFVSTSSQRLETTTPIGITSTFTLFGVGLHTNSATNGRIFEIRGTPNIVGGMDFGSRIVFAGNSTDTRFANSIGTSTAQSIGTVIRAASSAQYAFNGATLSTMGNPGTAAISPNRTVVGCACDPGTDGTGATYTAFLNGYVNEVIVYNSNLSDSDRQQVEDYLSRKWNVSLSRTILNLPSSHPFRLAPPLLRPFNPTDIATCALWLDAADRKTITLSGSNVTAWADKSGNGRNATTASGTPVYSSNSLLFTNAAMTSGNTVLSNRSYSVFCVAKPGETTGTQQMILATWKKQYGSFFFFANADAPDPIRAGISSGTTYSVSVSSGATVSASTTLFGVVVSGETTSSSATASLRGGAVTSNVSAQNYLGQDQNFTIGALEEFYVSTQFFYYSSNARIYEVIVFNSALTTAQRQQVESYLATKWGLQGSTPSTHPARIAPALTVQFQPTLLSNCALWLDAADQKTITLSGSSVTAWADKSSNAYSFAGVNTPRSGTATINGLNAIDLFTSSIAFLSNASISFSTPYSIFGVGIAKAATGGEQAFLGGAADTYLSMQIQTGTPSYNTWARNSTGGWAYNSVSVPTSNLINANVLLGMTATSGSIPGSFFNGSQLAFFESNAVGTATVSGLTIGRRGGQTNYWNGHIGEVILFTRVVSTTERQQVEGYLATKWGLQGSLPASHPYKNTPLL